MAIETPPVKTQPTKKGNSCLKIGGITCLTLLIVITVLSYILYTKFAKTPIVSQMSGCMQNLSEISGALSRYDQKNNAYPNNLVDLYPTFLENKSNLHCPADSSPADAVSYTYKKPDKKSSPIVPVVICDRHKILGSTVLLEIEKNGKIVQYTIPPEKGAKPIKGMEIDPNNIRK